MRTVDVTGRLYDSVGRVDGMGIELDDVDPATFLEDVEMRVGEVTAAEPFPEADKDLYRLEVDVGDETRRSAAGLTDNYRPADLVGRQVVAVVNLGTVSIEGFESRCLVTGVDDGAGGVVHLQPEREVPNGTRVY
jgi:tRNA-binding protein